MIVCLCLLHLLFLSTFFRVLLPLYLSSLGLFFAHFGLVFTTDELVSSLPLYNKIKEMVADKAIETVLLTKNSIRKNHHVFISTDKGNKKGNNHLVKFIRWYNIDDRKVKTFLSDVDCTDKGVDEIAGVLEHSLRWLLPTDIPVCIYEQCTDSGGGDTLEALARALEAKGLTSDRYLISSCTLHNP